MKSSLDLNTKTVKELRDQMDAAKAAGKSSFMFQGQEILVDYAKYVLEYYKMSEK